MARVIRLPDGRSFRPEPLVKDPTKLGMGNKGAFDFSETVKLLDQVAESKGVGAVANLVEKGYDAVRGDVKRPGEEEKTGDGPADALIQAAKARVKPAGTMRRPAAAMRREARQEKEEALPREAQDTQIRLPTPDPNRGPLFPANQEARRQRMMMQPAPMPAGGPAQAPAPQPPAPQFAPVPTQPAPGMIGGGAPIQGKATPMAQAQKAMTQVAANIGQEALRTEPVPAAGIDLSQYQSPTGQARGSIQFFSEMADELGKRGIGQSAPQAEFEIPYTVSVDELYGFARNATSLANQKKVLDALSNNRVTGMGFETLADRLSGRYRQRYLKNIVGLFPKVPNQPNLIDAIGKVGRAYSAEQLGRLRAGDVAAGLPGARAMKTRAQGARAAAGAQRAAEQAVTERELRAGRAQKILSDGVGKIFSAALRKSRRGRRGSKKVKVDLREFRAATTDQFTKEQDKLRAKLDRLDSEIAKKAGEAEGAKTKPPTRADAMINKASAGATLKTIRKGRAAQAELAQLRLQRDQAQAIFDGLAIRREAYDALHARMAAGYRPTPAEFEVAGISARQALQIIRAYGGIKSRRRGGGSKAAAPKGKQPAKIKF